MSKTLYILSGVAGCGKSTWAKARIKNDVSNIWKYVSRDEIRYKIITAEDEYFSHEKEVFGEFVHEILEGLRNDSIENIIADATHLNRPSREKLVRAIDMNFSNTNYQIVIIYFDVPVEVCRFRNNTRTGRARVPDEVITNMWKARVFPSNEFQNLVRIEIVRD